MWIYALSQVDCLQWYLCPLRFTKLENVHKSKKVMVLFIKHHITVELQNRVSLTKKYSVIAKFC